MAWKMSSILDWSERQSLTRYTLPIGRNPTGFDRPFPETHGADNNV
jgi:hypothetical protein